MRGRLPYSRDQRLSVSHANLIRSLIPDSFWDVSLEAIPDGIAYKEIIRKYIENLDDHVRDGVGLVLAGPHGSGKTSAAVIIAKEVLARGGSCRFVTEDKLVGAVINKEREDEDWTFERRVRETMMLVLDDLGMVPLSGGANIVERVMNERLQYARPTIITMNLGPGEFDSRYPALSERIKGRMLWVACSGINWREELEKTLRRRL